MVKYKLFYNANQKKVELVNNTKIRNLFVHIPRAAGTSIRTVLDKHIIDFGHNKLTMFNDRKNYYSFCFVRNPYQRFMSSYYYYKQSINKTKKGDIIKQEIDRFKNFEDFALNLQNSEYITNYNHFHTQKSYVYDNDDKLVNFIGYCEFLQRDLDILCNTIGIESVVAQRLNNSSHGAIKSEYTQDMKDHIYDYYIDDFKTFGYLK